MKVCLINNLYPPHARGGAEHVVYNTVQGLLQAGHSVVVITTAPGSRHVWREQAFTLYRFDPKNVFFYTDAHHHSFISRLLWHSINLFHFGAAREVARILQEEQPDVVHTHNLMGISFLIPRVIRRLGIRHLHTVHDVQLVEPSGVILKQKEHTWRYRGFPTKIYTAIMKRLLGSPDVVISPSQFLMDFYERRGFFPHAKRVVLRNPVTRLEESRPDTARGDTLHLLYLGQIEEHKGVLFLLRAFLASAPRRAVLHIAGAGSRLGEVQEIAGGLSTIIIHGKVEREYLPDLFRDTDILVVPSLCYENSPTVIFEALSFGIPVLASRVEGVAELIREGENGITFETGSDADLKRKLMWCAEHRDALRVMSTKTVQSLEGLSQEEYITRLQSLYAAS